MSKILSKRVNKVKPSATITISAKAMDLRAKGIDIIIGGAEIKKAEFLFFVIPLKKSQSSEIKNNRSLAKHI